MSTFGQVEFRPSTVYTQITQFFVNPIYSININQNVGFGGTPIDVHDGIDNVYWTGAAIAGTSFDFNSTAAPTQKDGLYSFEMKLQAAQNDTAQFAAGSPQDLTGYSTITMWIYIKSGWTPSDSVTLYGWSSGLVGNEVQLENYINIETTGAWAKAAIPLTDMGLTGETIDAFRLELAQKSPPAPAIHIDLFQIQETSGELIYTMAPPEGKILWLYSYHVHMIATYDGSLGISPYGFLGVTPDIGLQYKRYQGGILQLSATAMNLYDMLQQPTAKMQRPQYDGTNTWIIVDVPIGAGLAQRFDPTTDDRLEFSIFDDWSGLDLFRIAANAMTEPIPE